MKSWLALITAAVGAANLPSLAADLRAPRKSYKGQ